MAKGVTEIKGFTNLELRSHCNGKAKPADLPTRGQEPHPEHAVVDWSFAD